MKWNGIVSQLCHRHIATRFAAANATHAISSDLRRSNPVPRVANGLDRVGAELLPQAADADVDDVRARVEVVAPDLREQALAADDLAGVQDQVMEEPELAVGEVGDPVAEDRLAAREVDSQPARLDHAALPGRLPAELDADAR